MHPQTGGSYRREKDGGLTRIDAQATALAATEQEAEKPADTETPLRKETSGKKGKA